ncbi:hypothetical protein EAF00_006931 [Botryotinia globosa]|nr:hypothetical protein EAF00_006931 [Botryotinia globosa]
MAGTIDPNDPRKLTDFKLLSFDVYSTLIDEKATKPLFSRWALYRSLPPSLPTPRTPQIELSRFPRLYPPSLPKPRTPTPKSHPTLPYPSILHLAYLSYAKSLSLTPPSSISTLESEAQEFSQKIPNWPAFPDTVSALQKLHKHYKLVSSFCRILMKSL